MSNRNLLNSLRALLTVLFLVLLLSPAPARAEQDTEDTLGLFTAWQEQSSTASRAPKPLSQTAENVTAITRKEIEALNAHTLADILITAPGIQVDMRGSPGSLAFTNIQSSKYNHVLVLVDGVPLNSLNDNFSDVGSVPADIIERIEIVKGAASSSWGQALGGVINVITKSPEQGRTVSGAASASMGERTTSDDRLELSGTSNGLGYLLSGGYLGSNGVLQHRQLHSANGYGKLTYDLADAGQIFATFRYTRASQGELFLAPLGIDFQEDEDTRNLYATLGFRRNLGNGLELELFGRHAYRRIGIFGSQVSDGAQFPPTIIKENASGADLKLIWRKEYNLLVIGGDYEHDELKNSDIQGNFDYLNRKVDRWGIFLNDTLATGPVAITPGVRFDHTRTNGDQFSPSLGATWQLDDKTILRAYTAQGYSLPELVYNKPTEKIWTSQIGIESQVIPYLWLKGTMFRNETWNLQGIDTAGSRHIALGSELEARTTPILNTSLGAGWTYTDTYRTSDGTPVLGAPRHTLQLSVRYDDQTYRGMLTGRQIYWHSDPAFNGRYYGLIWDLHLGATLLKRENSSLELFFTGYNIFNGRMYQDEFTPSTGRWFEGGMKVRF
ncbi:MAG: TonB-dependent receptor [Geobacter sp.]|nr:MAG: TonB-dependent receptor [Geobacter sp.]